jgi:glycosyltransferase involved in cell wall biosynthesis
VQVYAYEDGTACGYYRIRLPFDTMKANGLDVEYSRQGTAPNDAIIVGQRLGGPGFMPHWLKAWRTHKLVWETDDDLWSIDPSNFRAKRSFTDDQLREIESAASIAHLVTVSTEPLAAVMRQFNDNVTVLPNHVDNALFDLVRPRRDRVTVGWAGGDSHLRDWEMVAPRLRRFLDRNPAVDFHSIGANYLIANKVRGRHTTWSTDLFDYYRSIDFDIGIAPLIPSQFNRSKSAIKTLEYAALGIPCIASQWDPYSDFVIDGVTGFLVSQDHEWERKLRDLVNDTEMRESMGAAAKEHARNWAIGDGWKLWESAYSSL